MSGSPVIPALAGRGRDPVVQVDLQFRRLAVSVAHPTSARVGVGSGGGDGSGGSASLELAYVPTDANFLNRIGCHFTALRYFAPNGTGHGSHEEQHSMIRRDIARRNRHTDDEALRTVSKRAKVA